MQDLAGLAGLLGAVASLLWPLLVIGVICLWREPLTKLVSSAASRGFTIKIAGQEISMDEASAQQRKLISDLQAQVTELMKVVGVAASPQPDAPRMAASEPPASPPTSILWVDDRPKDNLYFIEQLNQLGIEPDTALTTADGLAKFGDRKYSVVISDMGRQENGSYNSSAGLDLVKAIRQQDPDVPIVIFSSRRAAASYRAELTRLNATITSSPTELYGLLNLDRLKAA